MHKCNLKALGNKDKYRRIITNTMCTHIYVHFIQNLLLKRSFAYNDLEKSHDLKRQDKYVFE